MNDITKDLLHTLKVAVENRYDSAYWIDEARTAIANAESIMSQESFKYVKVVPDHCDRIIWRGSYYHLIPS